MNTNKNLIALGLVALLSGGATLSYAQDADVRVDGRALSFSNDAQPFYSGRTVLVPVREMAGKLGVGVDRNERGDSIRLTYRGDEAVYRKWRKDYMLNGRSKGLPAAGQERRTVMFIPVDIFRDLTDKDIDTGRGSGDTGGSRPGYNADVRYRGERLRFERNEEPRNERGTLMLALRATARQTGVSVDRNDRGDQIRLRHRDNTVEYEKGSSFELNGRRINMNADAEEYAGILYVPSTIFERLIGRDFQVGGGGWNNRPDWDDRPDRPDRPGGGWGGGDDRPNSGDRRVELVYRDRTMGFGGNEQPFQRGSTVYVPLRAFAGKVGVGVEKIGDGRTVMLVKAGDEVRYTQPFPYYELNGRRQNIRNGSLEIRDILFVPIDVFNVFTDGRVEIRRR